MRMIGLILISSSLVGCANVAVSSAQTVPATSVTQIQNTCFKEFARFKQQVTCIEERVSAYQGAESDPLIQEHMMYMRSVEENVSNKVVSEKEGRLSLVRELNALRNQRQQDVEHANSQNAQILETWRQNHQPLLNLPQPSHLSRSTDCQTNGTQMHCTTY